MCPSLPQDFLQRVHSGDPEHSVSECWDTYRQLYKWRTRLAVSVRVSVNAVSVVYKGGLILGTL